MSAQPWPRRGCKSLTPTTTTRIVCSSLGNLSGDGNAALVAAIQQNSKAASNIFQDIQQHELDTALQDVLAAANAFQGFEMCVEEGKASKEKADATTTLVVFGKLVYSNLVCHASLPLQQCHPEHEV